MRTAWALAYVTLSLPFGILTFVVVVVGLAIGISLVPVFLVGLPVLAALVPVVRWMGLVERKRAWLFLDADLPGRVDPVQPGESLARRAFRRFTSGGFWKEV